MCLNYTVPSHFVHQYPLFHFTRVTLNGRTNLHSADLLIMQSESEVRLHCLVQFSCPSTSLPSIGRSGCFPEPQSGVDKLWPGACLPCITGCIWGFSGQGLQGSSFRIPCGFCVYPALFAWSISASGWSHTVTNWIARRLSQQDPGLRYRLRCCPTSL